VRINGDCDRDCSLHVATGVDQMTQIGGNLRPGEFADFQRYAADLTISESSLANLLIQREMRLKRLCELAERLGGAVPTSERGGRVTGHQSSGELKEAFEHHAKEQGLVAGYAATIIFRAELEERWLAGCVGDCHAESH
jgi:hypothetical protein